MLKKPMQAHEIIELLSVHFGLDIQAVKIISGGADINALTYKVDTKSHSYFVKFKYGNHDEINLSIIHLLNDSGIKEIIYPIHTLEGKLFQQLEYFQIIVYPFIDAPNGFTKKLAKKQWQELGITLRKIHETSIPSVIQKQLRKEAYTSKWRDMVRSFYKKIEPTFTDDEITADFKCFFKQNNNIIYQLVDSAEALSKKIRPTLDRFVLCHSDIHAGNVLVVGDQSIYIIDWDEPMLAPKERDLMFIGGGVGNVWNNPQEIGNFYEGYGDVTIDNTMLSYYRHERIIEDIALYAQDLLAHMQSDQARLEMLKHFKEMFYPNGVVDIARSIS